MKEKIGAVEGGMRPLGGEWKGKLTNRKDCMKNEGRKKMWLVSKNLCYSPKKKMGRREKAEARRDDEPKAGCP